jgi:hypothetical protein
MEIAYFPGDEEGAEVLGKGCNRRRLNPLMKQRDTEEGDEIQEEEATLGSDFGEEEESLNGEKEEVEEGDEEDPHEDEEERAVDEDHQSRNC